MDRLNARDGGRESEDIRTREYQRVYAQVDLDAIEYNVKNMGEHISENTKIVAVVKADGYGHGSVEIARCLEASRNIFGFAVATAEEAMALRHAGIEKPVLILDYTFPYCYERLALEEIRPTVFRYDMVEDMSAAAVKAGKKIKVHIKVDTGMGRIGIMPDETGIQFIRFLKKLPGIETEGIFTHFARADETDKTWAQKQLQVFQEFVKEAEQKADMNIPLKHCSNSAGIMEINEANMDLVRAGIILYGLYPSDQVVKESVSLMPALSLHSHIIFVKQLHPGQTVSYGATFTAEREMRIATVPVGYGDGYPRALSNKGCVLIRGKRAPILGRVCMDQFMVDVTQIPEAAEGDHVTLLGRDGEQVLSGEELGEVSGRFNYELVCDLGKRIPRVYTKNGKVTAVMDWIWADGRILRFR